MDISWIIHEYGTIRKLLNSAYQRKVEVADSKLNAKKLWSIMLINHEWVNEILMSNWWYKWYSFSLVWLFFKKLSLKSLGNGDWSLNKLWLPHPRLFLIWVFKLFLRYLSQATSIRSYGFPKSVMYS